MTPDQLELWIDRTAIDKDNHKIGTIADVYVDDATGEPEWLAIMTGLFGSRVSFAPLLGAKEVGENIQVAYEKSLVKDSPNIDADGQLSEEEEERLYRHYGRPYRRSDAQTDTNPIVDVDQGELRLTGSASVQEEVSAEVAHTRLRRRDAQAVDALDLTGEEVTTDVSESDRPRSAQ